MTGGQIRHVAPAALDCSLGRLRLLPERAVQEKVESLRTKGQLSPLVAAAHEDALVLRRADALRLALATVRVEVVTLSPVQMKVQMVLRNRDRRLQLIEECRLVRECPIPSNSTSPAALDPSRGTRIPLTRTGSRRWDAGIALRGPHADRWRRCHRILPVVPRRESVVG